ncbi:uncharacterized protein At4g00950-like isoform X2 [Andrographis paniculata]|nr:uncharacterized protein At4g00950-like isoform X2 [Andrographis paniculata]
MMGDSTTCATPPKLTLSKPPPWKPREPLHMLTPPLHPSASIPFQWEEAPGKPRAAAPPDKAARCLDLPPRLMLHDEAKITTIPSPTAVLDGPYVGRSLSLACTLSFRKGPPADGADEEPGRASFDFSYNDEKVKITRIGRRKSFFSLPSMNPNL